MSKEQSSVVVLHSGGLDSTVCLLLAIEQGFVPVSVGIDYGQRHSVELQFAQRQCARFGVERRLLAVRWDKPDRPLPLDRGLEQMRASVSPAFLPGRNILFLSLAIAEAAGIGATQVWTGVNSVDFSGYPDCRPEFIEAFRAMIRSGMTHSPELVAPLQFLPKREIARLAHRLGVGKGDTWSCYRPVDADGSVIPCGRCDACILHEEAWKGVDEP